MADRGRDISTELSEIRTIYKRSKTALDVLRRNRNRGEHGYESTQWNYKTQLWERVLLTYGPDPDITEMIEILEDLVSKTERWARTGSTANDSNLVERKVIATSTDHDALNPRH